MRFGYPRRVEAARTPTPVEPLERLSRRLGGPRIWVKRDDLTGTELSGNKVRKLEFLFAEALDAGADTVVTCGGIQSNHCRATALLAARLGLSCHLVLRGSPPNGTPEGNLFLDRMAGTRITWVTREEYREIDAVYMRLARELSGHGARCYFIPEGGSNAVGALGYVRAALEIARESEPFTHVVHAVGSGGTSAGLVLGRRLHDLPAKLLGVAVCDDAGHFYEKIGRIAAEATHKFGLPEIERIEDEIEILDGHIGPGYALSTSEIRETMVEAARTEGLVLDPVYTGKAFHGLVQEIRAGRFAPSDRVLFLHTGGIFGLLAARADFAGEL